MNDIFLGVLIGFLIVMIIQLTLILTVLWEKSEKLDNKMEKLPKGKTQFLESVSPEEQIDNIFKENE